MVQVFLAPRSNEKSHTHFASTIEGGVPFSAVSDVVSDDTRQKLPQDKVFAWGNKPGLRNRWKKMRVGDIVLFYAKKRFVHWGRVLALEEGVELGKRLWPLDDDGIAWSCVYFLTDLHSIDLPIGVIREFAGYESTWDRVQGFMRLRQRAVALIEDQFGTVESFLNEPVEQLIPLLLEKAEEDLVDPPEDPGLGQTARVRDTTTASPKEFITQFTRDERKLGKANRVHQELVNYFVTYFTERGIVPHEDRQSFDLLAENGSTFFLFEMKSTSNLKSQVRAGVAQLLAYEFFRVQPLMSARGIDNCVKALVLDRKPPKKYLAFLDSLEVLCFWRSKSRFEGPFEKLL